MNATETVGRAHGCRHHDGKVAQREDRAAHDAALLVEVALLQVKGADGMPGGRLQDLRPKRPGHKPVMREVLAHLLEAGVGGKHRDGRHTLLD